jgi:hypothetical protein
MKRFLIIVLMISVFSLILTSCSKKEDVDFTTSVDFVSENSSECSFTKIKGDCQNVTVYVHNETGVMYMFVAQGYSGGLVVMCDIDGSPLIYEGVPGSP